MAAARGNFKSIEKGFSSNQAAGNFSESRSPTILWLESNHISTGRLALSPSH